MYSRHNSETCRSMPYMIIIIDRQLRYGFESHIKAKVRKAINAYMTISHFFIHFLCLFNYAESHFTDLQEMHIAQFGSKTVTLLPGKAAKQ